MLDTVLEDVDSTRNMKGVAVSAADERLLYRHSLLLFKIKIML